MKKILVVYFSQSGQLRELAENFSKPLSEAGHTVEFREVRMKKPFPFPWNPDAFFDGMPESVLGIPAPVEEPPFAETRYDLVVLAYQPWFLSPSIPTTSILHHPEFQMRLKDTPVVTLIGARNMWINAQERVKPLLKQSGGRIVGNIVFADRHNNFVSAVTIQHWMYSGKKDKLWGIFPKPGVAEGEIQSAGKFGIKVKEVLESGFWDGLQLELLALKAVEVKTLLMFIESRGPKIFALWANAIIRKKNRTLWLKIFKYYLLFAMFIIAPLLLLVYTVLIRPFTGRQIRERKKYFSGVN